MRKELEIELKKLPAGYDEMTVIDLVEWVAEKHNIRAELFFSMFHKTWGINNYFIDTKKSKKIWPKVEVKERFVYHDEAREVALAEMLKLI